MSNTKCPDNLSGCDISTAHRHPTVNVAHESGTPSENNPARKGLAPTSGGHPFFNQELSDVENRARNAHFDVGIQEHLPKNVVSMNAFIARKAAKRPEGY